LDEGRSCSERGDIAATPHPNYNVDRRVEGAGRPLEDGQPIGINAAFRM
jgi:hypothetical protein